MSHSQSIPYPVIAVPTSSRPLLPKLFSGPTIPKCAHGSYTPQPERESGEPSPYCILCGGTGSPANARPVVLPRSSNDPLDESGRKYANKRSGIGCPECGDHIYLRVNENGGDAKRECASCGHVYRRRSTDHERALAVEAEME